MSSEPPLLELENVGVHFEDKPGLLDFGGETETVRAVDGVSLTLDERDVLSWSGESGCGKTTTRQDCHRPPATDRRERQVPQPRHLGGPRRQNRRRHHLEGYSHVAADHPPGSGRLAQSQPAHPSLSSPSRSIRSTRNSVRAKRERIYALLERVGMNPAADFAERYPHQLLGWRETARRAEPRAVDEPRRHPGRRGHQRAGRLPARRMMDLMHELQNEFNTSFVFISHDLSNARYFTAHAGGQIGVMYLGELAEIGPAEDMISDPRHPYTNVFALGDAGPRSGRPATRRCEDRHPGPGQPTERLPVPTRCPEAREACKQETPPNYRAGEQRVAWLPRGTGPRVLEQSRTD